MAFQNQLTPVELEYHHMQYCAFLNSQNRLLGTKAEKLWLADAFKSFGNIAIVVYGEKTKDCVLHMGTCRQKKSMDWRTMSPTAKETLVEQQNHVDIESNALSFAALLEASRANPGCVKSVEASVTWRMFTLEPSNFADNAKTLRHLTLEISQLQPREENSLAKIIGSAEMLQTLRLSFKAYIDYFHVDLEDLLVYRRHWPCLETFRATGIWASDSALRKFLGAHAGTLRSLELGDANIYEGVSEGTWVAMITFLQQNLDLTHIQLDSMLGSDHGLWLTRTEQYYELHPDELPRPIIPFPQDCLRKRIERYVLHGGKCPLRMIDDTEIQMSGRLWGLLLAPRLQLRGRIACQYGLPYRWISKKNAFRKGVQRG